jgi:hypothetical protein
LIILYNSFLLVIDYLIKSSTSFTTSREALVLVELIVTCRALSLMRLAHFAKYILCAHTIKYNNFHPLDAIAYHDITCRATRSG